MKPFVALLALLLAARLDGEKARYCVIEDRKHSALVCFPDLLNHNPTTN